MDYAVIPCGCFACDEQPQPGHFVCEAPPDWALELERAGEIARHYDGTRWIWETCDV